MPELPEVETLRRSFLKSGPAHPSLVGLKILRSDLGWRRTLAAPGPRIFARRIHGQTVTDVSRRGKLLLFRLSGAVLISHLRMSGGWVLHRQSTPRPDYCRLSLQLNSGWRLSFRDPRKFGRIWLLDDAGELLGRLGPEPLAPAFTADLFRRRLAARRRRLKPLLLDQSFLAGLGNIYVDEALHRARLHPLTLSHQLDRPAGVALWRGIRQVLREAIRYRGTSFDGVYTGGRYLERLRVYRRTGCACATCQARIQRILVAQRGTHICPHCQPAPALRPGEPPAQDLRRPAER
ncbi:MAG: bifunctional DNA-formamidopyrimidine glycosylase/DNA-(apurinic or apyrimidinic site) lyase [Candidatus Eisenbacteria bacterium]|nr:bifunctional DNA-formamidopyrimidine glycosylase/DNA-(apurinic or apyrimidinic site) lyase [Candidatus Eisenbacteria bacterium]